MDPSAPTERRAKLLLAGLALAALLGGVALALGAEPGGSQDPAADLAGPDARYAGKPVQRFLFYDLALASMLRGAGNTLLLTVMSMPLAVVAGVGLAAMRLSHHWFLKAPAATYIEVIRGTPLLVQILLVHFSLAELGQTLDTKLLTLEPFTTGVICLAGNYAAYEAEIIRAGLEAVDKGHREAALSLGMSERQSFFLVVLPQAFRIVVPPLINDLIAMLKDSCLVNVIGVGEILERARSIGKERANTAQMMVIAAVLYLGMSLACYFLGKWLEKRLKVRGAPELHVENPHGH